MHGHLIDDTQLVFICSDLSYINGRLRHVITVTSQLNDSEA